LERDEPVSIASSTWGKHLNADDQSTLNRFKETDNDFVLYVCAEDYVRFRSLGTAQPYLDQ
jgi:hypothetical protein